MIAAHLEALGSVGRVLHFIVIFTKVLLYDVCDKVINDCVRVLLQKLKNVNPFHYFELVGYLLLAIEGNAFIKSQEDFKSLQNLLY